MEMSTQAPRTIRQVEMLMSTIVSGALHVRTENQTLLTLILRKHRDGRAHRRGIR